MEILIVDDETLVLDNILFEMRKVFPKAKLVGLNNSKKVEEYIKDTTEKNKYPEYTFLDMRIGSVSGIYFAKLIKDNFPDTKVIFCTAYSNYACGEGNRCATGYLLKPIISNDIEKVVENIDDRWLENNLKEKSLVVKTFGKLEIFYDGKEIVFGDEKQKELIAYLLFRGEPVAKKNLVEVLWPDVSKEGERRRLFKTTFNAMMEELKKYNLECLIIKKLTTVAIDSEKIISDANEFRIGNNIAVNSYRGNYMDGYEWARFIL